MPSLLRTKLAIQFFSLLLIGTGVIVGVKLVQERQELRKEASTYGNLGCSSITISPSKTKYTPGETVSIKVSGDLHSANIDLYWKSAYLPMKGAGWVQIPGSYDPSTQTLNANWVVPSQSSLNWTPATTLNQEIILTANNFDANGNFCSGNPGHLNCYDGIYISGGSAQLCCGGCQIKIAVDSTPGSGINTKDYLKFNPGNYWEYDGTNFTYSTSDPNRDFEARVEIEPPTNVCGHKTQALRFLKDKASGYWGPVHSYEEKDQWRGDYARRWHTLYFPKNDRWNGEFVGAIYPNSQKLLPPPDHFKGIGTRIGQSAWFTSKGQHFYYPPYLVAPDNLPNDLNWGFSRQDQIFTFDGTSNSNYCDNDDNIDYNTRSHAWETSYSFENVSTPSYSGQALRIKFLEYDLGGTSPGVGFLLREDWFFC